LIENAVSLFHTLGYEKPRIAVSAPIDYIHPKIPATTEAAQLTGMSKNGEIKDCEVYGPVTFEAATNREIALKRGIKNYVAGDADIILVDSIEECNIISKVLILFSPAAFAGVIVGAKVPVSLIAHGYGICQTGVDLDCLFCPPLKRQRNDRQLHRYRKLAREHATDPVMACVEPHEPTLDCALDRAMKIVWSNRCSSATKRRLRRL
jgi:hypothetical protein